MLAVRLHGKRDLQVEHLEDPRPPGPGEVLLRVRAAGICGSDLHTYRHARIGDTDFPAPLILGHEFSGMVQEAGPDTVDGEERTLPPGVRVAVDPAQNCGICELCRMGHPNLCTNLHFCGLYPDNGCFCELMVVPSRTCFPLPDTIDDTRGALLEPLGVALHAVDLAKIKPGTSVVVLGAGPIGLLILQAVLRAGASPLYVVEPLMWRLSLAKEMGGIPIDPGEMDPVGEILRLTRGRGVDVVIEAANGAEAIAQAAEMARPGGRVILVGIPEDDGLLMKHSTARRKGLTILLSRRMKHVYPRAIRLAANGLFDLGRLVTHRVPLSGLPRAFQLNSEYQEKVVKVIAVPSDG